jgi:hypothetical protein
MKIWWLWWQRHRETQEKFIIECRIEDDWKSVLLLEPNLCPKECQTPEMNSGTTP